MQQHQQQQYQQYQKINKTQRSKSMEDFTSQIVFENNRVHRNNLRNNMQNNFMSQSTQALNKRPPPLKQNNQMHQQQIQQKNQLRYSVDNLLEIDTSYYNNNNYQVRIRKIPWEKKRFAGKSSDVTFWQVLRCEMQSSHKNAIETIIFYNSNKLQFPFVARTRLRKSRKSEKMGEKFKTLFVCCETSFLLKKT